MSQYQQLTPKESLVLKFIEKNPDCIQQDVINFSGDRTNTQMHIYKLLSRKFIKQRKGNGGRKHYSIDKRKKF